LKSLTKESAERLERFRSLYAAAKLSDSERISAMQTAMEQYLGSEKIDGSTESASYVRNITFEIIESEIDPNVPLPKVDARYADERRLGNALAAEKLCKLVRERLPFEELNDRDERYTYIYGASVWFVEWDSSLRYTNESGGIRVHCIPPTDFVGQPGISEIDDMEYCFLRFCTTKSELMRKYGVTRDEISRAEIEYEYTDGGTDEDTATVINTFYRDADGEIGYLAFSGEVLLADIPRFYKRKIALCSECGAYFGECDCIDTRKKYAELPTETVDSSFHPKIDGNIELEYYTPRSFPIVIRRNTRTERTLYGISDCLIMRPQQQAINKVESRILKKLLRAGIFPIMPEDASVTAGNSIFGEVIRTRPGEGAEGYGKLDTTPDVTEDILEADRLYDQAKRVIGISDALQGTDTTLPESGYARELKINRASSRLQTKKRIKYHTYSRLYELIFRHYLAFSDRLPPAKGDSAPSAVFDRYSFIEPSGDGTYSYSDDYLFSVDLNSGSEYGREVVWQKNLENLESGTLGSKNEPETLLRYWRSQEKAHYPFARENVEYFENIIKSKRKDDHNGKE